MKKLLPLAVVFGLITVALMTGCKKEEPVTPPAMPSTNAPAK